MAKKNRHSYSTTPEAPMAHTLVFIEQLEEHGWELVDIAFGGHAQIRNAISVPGHENDSAIALYRAVVRKEMVGDALPERPQLVDPNIILRERMEKEGRNGKDVL